jgi:hypothetical protein
MRLKKMGGRSREPKTQVSSFSFLGELSNERLNHYGAYSSGAFQNLDGTSITQHGIPSNHEGLNIHAADEYIRRHGSAPSWDLRVNEGVQHHSGGFTVGVKK